MKNVFACVLLAAFIGLVFTGCHRQQPRMKKPVIYVYSNTKQPVEVKLAFNGTLKATYPLYQNGWKFMADTNGNLMDTKTGETYQYLFYDGLSAVEYKSFTEGFCVKTDTVIDFLKHTLTYLGLNEKEQNDMISFWIPELNEKAFSLMRFKTNEACNEGATLKITPAPETEIRVMLEFLPANTYQEIREQKLKPATRSGFTVVEWGGVNLQNTLPEL
ncbi:MAG TPA: hypothetical protein VK177_21520 [Flavobacteriales bacterium]|nr:hypothetical protein [Flavobacteriales bacterium]